MKKNKLKPPNTYDSIDSIGDYHCPRNFQKMTKK